MLLVAGACIGADFWYAGPCIGAGVWNSYFFATIWNGCFFATVLTSCQEDRLGLDYTVLCYG